MVVMLSVELLSAGVVSTTEVVLGVVVVSTPSVVPIVVSLDVVVP